VAACGFRYDAELVPDFKENLEGVVDQVILMDDRGHDSLWRNEHEYRLKIRKLALDAGADWLYITSPDERIQKGAAKQIRRLVEENDDVIIEFNLRELWTPDRYRTDGIWGRKKRYRLYPLKPGQKYCTNKIQASAFPIKKDGSPLYPIVRSNLDIFHLKMINPANRVARAEVFKKLDPNNKYQEIGYDYLHDEAGLKTQTISRGKMYHPPYKGYDFKVPEKYMR